MNSAYGHQGHDSLPLLQMRLKCKSCSHKKILDKNKSKNIVFDQLSKKKLEILKENFQKSSKTEVYF